MLNCLQVGLVKIWDGYARTPLAHTNRWKTFILHASWIYMYKSGFNDTEELSNFATKFHSQSSETRLFFDKNYNFFELFNRLTEKKVDKMRMELNRNHGARVRDD